MIYKKKLSFIPKLIKFDDKERTLTIKRVGTQLDKKYTVAKLKKDYLPKMRELSKKFYKSFGLYHNDLKFMNFVESGTKLYLIDFEYASKTLGGTLKDNTGYRKLGKLYDFN